MGRLACLAEGISCEPSFVASRSPFVVVTTSPLYQQHLLKMGWSQVTYQSFARSVANAPDLKRIFADFDAHLEEMLLQGSALRPVRLERALEEFPDRVNGSGLGWWMYGSGALAARGSDIEPRDFDLAVDDPHLAAEVLNDLLVEPTTPRPGLDRRVDRQGRFTAPSSSGGLERIRRALHLPTSRAGYPGVPRNH